MVKGQMGNYHSMSYGEFLLLLFFHVLRLKSMMSYENQNSKLGLDPSSKSIYSITPMNTWTLCV